MTNRSTMVDLANYVYSGEWELLEIKVLRNEVCYACCDVSHNDKMSVYQSNIILNNILLHTFSN